MQVVFTVSAMSTPFTALWPRVWSPLCPQISPGKVGDPPPDKHDSMSDGWTHLRPHPLGNPKKPRKDRQYGNFAQPSGGFGPEMGMVRTLQRKGAGKLP